MASFYYINYCTYHSSSDIKYPVGGAKSTFRFKLALTWQYFIILLVECIAANLKLNAIVTILALHACLFKIKYQVSGAKRMFK